MRELKVVYGFPPTTPRWASLFAFLAPDEDFIETYKLWVLTNARTGDALTSLQITMPDGTAIRRDHEFQ